MGMIHFLSLDVSFVGFGVTTLDKLSRRWWAGFPTLLGVFIPVGFSQPSRVMFTGAGTCMFTGCGTALVWGFSRLVALAATVSAHSAWVAARASQGVMDFSTSTPPRGWASDFCFSARFFSSSIFFNL